jgi:multidrug resistance protein
MNQKATFQPYQKFMVALLAVVQFTIILDFMVLSPLGPYLMDDMGLLPDKFASVVSAYAFSAFVSAVLTAGFADRFDRKKILIFFYCGFVLGTLFCALATSYETLLAARIFTGLFGGVISSIVYAIITDLFSFQQRGRVMGFVQMAFAGSQILGIPIGLYLANLTNWHLPFYSIVVFSLLTLVVVYFKMKPITEHIEANKGRNAFKHFGQTLRNKRYARGFIATTLLATGGFMLMPFGSEFATKNLKISFESLPLLYLITGVFSMMFGPLFGKLSDTIGKLKIYIFGTSLAILFVGIYTSLGVTPFYVVVLLNIMLFAGITGRMISATALITSIPTTRDRGAFMSINSAVQQLSGGIASLIAGSIVFKNPDNSLGNYSILGAVVIGTMLISILLMVRVDKMLNKEDQTKEELKVEKAERAEAVL